MDKAENMQCSGNQESPAFRHGESQEVYKLEVFRC